VRRRWLVITIVVGLLALLPGAALASGAAAQGQGPGPLGVPTTQSTAWLEIEADTGWCATQAYCSYDSGPADAYFAAADAYRYDNNSHATPNFIYGECDHAWTDSMGVRQEAYAWVTTYSTGGLEWLMNSGSESNTAAMATIDASGVGDNGFVQIQGFLQANNASDHAAAGTGFTVTIIGTIFHRTYMNGDWTDEYTTFGSMTCKTNPPATNGLFVYPYQRYTPYGEAENPDPDD